jgi:hypothetical protein
MLLDLQRALPRTTCFRMRDAAAEYDAAALV